MVERLTPEKIQDRIHQISREARWPDDGDWDDGTAHKMCDELHLEVLHALAMGDCEDPRACAFMATQTEELDFSRWYE